MDAGGKVVAQPTNELGRIARALPMFLAEEVYLRTNARTAFLLPWMKQGGFILSAQPWTRGFLPPDHVAARSHRLPARRCARVAVVVEGDDRAAARGSAHAGGIRAGVRPARPPRHDALALLHDLIPRLTRCWR